MQDYLGIHHPVTASLKTALDTLPSGQLPTSVRDFEVRFGYDQDNDPAIWITVNLKKDKVLVEVKNKLREIIRDECSKFYPEFFAFISFAYGKV